MDSTREADVRLGIRIEVISFVWMVIEMIVSIGAGIAAGSVLLTAFGIDSLIELVSGGILIWRLRVERRGGDVERVENAEKSAARIVVVTLALLCLYVLITPIYGLVSHSKPESSLVGIGVAAVAVLLMPYLAVTKRRIARRINSSSLAGDAANSFTCAYMAATVLVGLALNRFLSWWWAEDVAALLFLVWLARETWEVFEEVRRP